MPPSIEKRRTARTPQRLEIEKHAYDLKRAEMIKKLGGKCITCGMPYLHLLQIRPWYGDKENSKEPRDRPLPKIHRGGTMTRLRQQEQLIKERGADLLCRWCIADESKFPRPLHRLNPLKRPWHLVTFYCGRCDALIHLKDSVRGQGDQLCCCKACAKSDSADKENPACGCKDLADDEKFMPPALWPENCVQPEYDRETFYQMRRDENFVEMNARIERIEHYFKLWDIEEKFVCATPAPPGAETPLTDEMKEINASSYWRLLWLEWSERLENLWDVAGVTIGLVFGPAPKPPEIDDPFNMPPDDFKERYPGYRQEIIVTGTFWKMKFSKILAPEWYPCGGLPPPRCERIFNRVTEKSVYPPIPDPPKKTRNLPWLKNDEISL